MSQVSFHDMFTRIQRDRYHLHLSKNECTILVAVSNNVDQNWTLDRSLSDGKLIQSDDTLENLSISALRSAVFQKCS